MYSVCEMRDYCIQQVQPILKEVGCGPTWNMLLLQDGFAVTFVFLTVAAAFYHSYTLAALAGNVVILIHIFLTCLGGYVIVLCEGLSVCYKEIFLHYGGQWKEIFCLFCTADIIMFILS